MGFTSGLIGAGGALAGLFGGGGASSVPLPPTFNMPNMGGAANSAYGGVGKLGQYTSMASSAMPYAQNTFPNLYNNPHPGGMQQGAGGASGLGENPGIGASAPRGRPVGGVEPLASPGPPNTQP